ncbi:ATP-binding protein [Streptomyces sp. NBC_00358]
MTSPPPPSSPRPGSATLPATRWLHAGESVTLFGPVGVGKTHIAQALGHLAVRQGAQVPLRQDQSDPGRAHRRPRGPHLGQADP